MTGKILKVFSPQHLARNWAEDSDQIAKALVRLFDNSPTFNYNAVFSAIRDLLVLGVPFEDIKRGIKEKIGREQVRDNYLEILELVRTHFDGEVPDFVNSVSPRHYPLARSENGKLLSIPFTAPMVYGIGGRLVFPWFLFWKSNPLVGEKLALFTTIVKDILSQDPDLEDAKFIIHDYSAKKKNESRSLEIIDANDIPVLSNTRRDEMLVQYADGFHKAQSIIAARQTQRDGEERRREADPRQPDLFL